MTQYKHLHCVAYIALILFKLFLYFQFFIYSSYLLSNVLFNMLPKFAEFVFV